jgi:hypothetical protein
LGSFEKYFFVAPDLIRDPDCYPQTIFTRPAYEVKDESDLGMLPVTVDVPPLPVDQISEALKRGAQTAGNFIRTGKIEAAYLSLQKQTLVVENNLKKELNE